MKQVGELSFILTVLIGLTVGLWSCGTEPEPVVSTFNVYGVTPSRTPIPSPTLTYTPTPAPSPTPEPYKSPTPSTDYFVIRKNMNLMTKNQLDVYVEEMKGKRIENWTGFVKEKPLLDDGYYGIALELDKEPGDRPDLILTKVDESVLNTIDAGQVIRFSATVTGLTNVYDMNNILALSEVMIHKE